MSGGGGAVDARRPRPGAALLALAALLLAAAALPARAFYKSEGTIRTAPGQTREESNREYFTDLPVVTHEGKAGRFYGDFLKGRVVLVNFFYTTCPTADPDMARLARVRELLGDEFGKTVFLVSVSVDPETDTVEAVGRHADKYPPGNGWVFLTGKPENLRWIGYKLGNPSPDPAQHVRVYLLGNLKTGRWMKMNQYAPPESVAEGLRVLLAEGGE